MLFFALFSLLFQLFPFPGPGTIAHAGGGGGSASIVQTATYAPTSGGANITITLSASPTAGNILVAFTSYSQANGANTLSAPAGQTWTQVDNLTGGNAGDSFAVWWHLVQAGDPTGYTFTESNNSDFSSGVLFEISGASTTAPINGHAISSYTTSTASVVSPSVTPSVLNCLALAATGSDGGTGDGQGINSVSSGWTAGPNGLSTWHSTLLAKRTALTTDTTTAITNTFTTSASTVGVAATVLIH